MQKKTQRLTFNLSFFLLLEEMSSAGVPCRHVLALYISVKYPDRVRGHIKLSERVQEEEESV